MFSETRRWQRYAVVGLLACHAVLLLVSLRRNFVTFDESAHIPAGLSNWHSGSFIAYRVNPPLSRMLAVVPLLAARPDIPATHGGPPGYRPEEWDLSTSFSEANRERYVDLICLARLPGVCWSLLGGWLVYRWARDLYGNAGGLLALTVWCFEPNILAHAPLATPDVPATVAGLAACYLFWRYLRQPTWSAAWFAGLGLGVAELTKFTWLILYALWPVLALLYWRLGSLAGASGWGRRASQMALVFALSLVVLNLGYGWQGTGRPLGESRFVSSLFSGETLEEGQWGNRFRDTSLARIPVPLPADYVLGIDLQRRDFEANWPFYLNGQWQEGGTWYFYLYALAIKVPLGILALVLTALALTLIRRPRGLSVANDLFLWLPAIALLVFVSSQTGLNYLRYTLPLFPFAIVGTGRLAVWCAGVRSMPYAAAIVLGLLVWAVGSSLAAFPHSLAYFNETVGGPAHGHEHLVDSNLDWGQDLLYLKAWLDEHPEARPLHLAYFNHVDPRIIGIEYSLPPLPARDDMAEDGPPPAPHLAAGWYAVSVNFLQGGAFVAPDGAGAWQPVPLHGFEYFQRFQPVAKAGMTIWIFHVTDEAR